MNQSRRKFIKTSVIATSALSLGVNKILLPNTDNEYMISGFTRDLNDLSYQKMAEAVSQLGWSGIECPVRPNGQILPERVEYDLPKMVNILKKYNLKVDIMATAIHNPEEKYTEQILRTASQLGIKYYRLGWWQYDFTKSMEIQLNDIKNQLKELSALNKELGIIGVYQNHSGGVSFGAPIWDLYEVLSSINSEYIGSHFDIGHAVLEGPYSWRINFERIKKYIKAVIVKDFRWLYTENQYGKPDWCPIGKGMVPPLFFKLLRDINFDGPITMHFPYSIDGEGTNKLSNLLKAMKKDSLVLRDMISSK